MKDMERELLKVKEEFEMMKAPDEMEQILRKALKHNKTGRKLPVFVASAFIVLLLITYSYDAIAYYSRKLTGYDNVIHSSLQKLYVNGKGQEIGKTCTFSDKTSVTIDGIMFDEKELVVFYTVHNPIEKIDYHSAGISLSGLNPMGYYPATGSGHMIDDHTIVKIMYYKPPLFYERWMKFKVKSTIDGRVEKKEIGFTLNRNLAMKKIIKKDLAVSVEIGDYNIRFDEITASAMSTVIEGSIIPPETHDNGLDIRDLVRESKIPRLVFDLIVDGTEVAGQRGTQEWGGSMDNIIFSVKKEALPETFSSIRIDNIRLETMPELLDISVEISEQTQNLNIVEDLIVREVRADENATFVTVASKGVPVIGLFKDGKQLECSNYDSFKYEAEQNTALDRTFRFEGTGEKLELKVKYIRCLQYADESVDIPVD